MNWLKKNKISYKTRTDTQLGPTPEWDNEFSEKEQEEKEGKLKTEKYPLDNKTFQLEKNNS